MSKSKKTGAMAQMREELHRTKNQLREANIELRRVNSIVLDTKKHAQEGTRQLQDAVSATYVCMVETFGKTQEDGSKSLTMPLPKVDPEKFRRTTATVDAKAGTQTLTMKPEA